MVYLDDRPVIEQLTEPTPANVIHDVLARATDRALDAESDICKAMEDRLDDMLADYGMEVTAEQRPAVLEFLGLEAAHVVDLIREALNQFADDADAHIEDLKWREYEAGR